MELYNITENADKRLSEAEMFTRRFGTFSKSDYETLLFTIFLDSLDSPARDYDISIALGITESKVRNLRIRSQLLYPKELKWQDELAIAIQHGAYDSYSKQITVTIEDPSVQNLIKNIIEKNFGTVGQSLNVKHLVLPVDSFLLISAYAEQDPEKTLKELNNIVQEQSKSINVIEKRTLKTRFLQNIPDIPQFIATALTIYDIGCPIIESVLQMVR